MTQKIIHHLSNLEGILDVVTEKKEQGEQVYLRSGYSTHMEMRLKNRYPLEAIQLTQQLSAKSGVAHAIAATLALENVLSLEPTAVAKDIRRVLLKLSTLHSHIHHFYWEILPAYVNREHKIWGIERFYSKVPSGRPKSGDLSKDEGRRILNHIEEASKVLFLLQQLIAQLGGKFPVIMNMIPGGVTNFSLKKEMIMSLLRILENIKEFVEKTWPDDVKSFVKDVPESLITSQESSNLICFGSLPPGDPTKREKDYSAGVLIDNKLELLNELKITESLDYTFYRAIQQQTGFSENIYDSAKPEARTWIKGARYETETMQVGALSRMLVTHFGGGNLTISNIVAQFIGDLGLTPESANCLGSRLLSEVFEARLYMEDIMKSLLELDLNAPVNQKREFDFSANGAGIGKVEAPGGSLLHQVFIQNGKIAQYRIISPVNWNFSTNDEFGKTGIVERELNRLLAENRLNSEQCERILSSYYLQVLDGTQ